MENNTVKGLYYYQNLLNNTQEIIQQLNNQNWVNINSNPKSRKVQHYGYYYNYITYKINEPAPPMPDFILQLRDLLTVKSRELGLIDDNYVFNQCIVNSYEAGEGIAAHIDHTNYGKVIGCFTLGSSANMKFILDNNSVNCLTENGSLYIMSGDARYKWKHQMVAQKYDIINGIKINRSKRISITFRNVPQ